MTSVLPNERLTSKRALPIIRVFVSSTFSDLKHERNALHAQVWPELERYCQQRGFTFQAIDLRWGVPAEAGLDHRTMRICFEELRRSQDTSPEPNFLILLGNRYGWRPLPEVISVAEFQRLVTAASEVAAAAANDPAKDVRLRRAAEVLQQWYLLDENAKPFGEQTPAGEYVLRSRKTSPDGVDYGRQPDATGKLRDTAAWVDVQFVLWSIINEKRAFPAADLAGRFQTLHETSPGTVPPSVRFQASATEQEIWQGALQVANADRHVIAAVREIDDLEKIPDTPRRGDFIDLKDDKSPDGDASKALTQLKSKLEELLGESKIIRSTCQWAVDEDEKLTGDITTTHLAQLCNDILKRLKDIIIEQINAYWGCDLSAADATLAQVRGSQQELDLECADHLRFAGERAPEKTFVGRESELQRIRDYLHSKTNQPFVLHGPSGSGKTALLGKIIQEVTPSRSADGTRAKAGPIVLSRFIGTTPESSNLRSLLSSLCRELRQHFEMPAPLPTDLNELIDEFYSQLAKATAARPVVVFLDALDQLDAANHGRSVFWIRSPLSSTTDTSCHARMIVSCLAPSDEFPEDSDACEPFRDLKLRKLLGNHELGALDESDARRLFANWLDDAKRSVSKTQQDMIRSAMQKSSACRQPLFLKVLFEEARQWRSFDAPSAIPESLARLLDELFTRLGKPSEHGELIGIALSCLVSARYGLSEGELLEVLYADERYKAILAEDNKRNGHELPPVSNRIPIAPWTRLRSDLAPYLSERSAPGTAVMYFYHRQVEQAVRKRYLLTHDQQTSRHRQLANYFDDRWNRPDAHALMELPYLRLLCQDHDDLLRLLMDLQFPMRKTHAGYVSDLVRDYDSLRARVAGETRDSHAPWYYFIRSNASFLREHPASFFQQAYNEPVDSPVSQAAQQRWSEATEGHSLDIANRNDVTEAFLEWTNRPTNWQPPACLMTLTGHKSSFYVHGSVYSVAVTPDGGTVVSGSIDHTIKIWNACNGACQHTLSGHNDAVWSVVMTPDGGTVVSGSGDNTVKIWDARTRVCRHTLFGHSRWVHCVAVTPDGGTVVSGSEDKTVKIWDARTGTCRYTFSEHNGNVYSVALTPDGGTVVSGSKDKTVKIWDARTGACRYTLSGHTISVTSVAVTPDGGTVISGSLDKSVKIWDARTGVCRHTLSGHNGEVLSVAVTPDGGIVVSGSLDETVKIWDMHTGACRHTLSGHNSHVLSVAVTPDGGTVVSGSLDETIKIWDARTDTYRHTHSGHNGLVNNVVVTSDGGTIISGSMDKTVKIWDARTGACRHTLSGHTSSVDRVAVTPDGGTVVSSSKGDTIKIWNARTGVCRHTLSGHNHWVNRVAVTPDGGTVVSGSDDNTVKIWDARTAQCLETHPTRSDAAGLAWAKAGSQSTFNLLSPRGHLVYRLTLGEEEQLPSLATPGPFDKANGPLADDTILAFTANGEAHWFRIRRRDRQ